VGVAQVVEPESRITGFTAQLLKVAGEGSWVKVLPKGAREHQVSIIPDFP
jgi:hypothetical protein